MGPRPTASSWFKWHQGIRVKSVSRAMLGKQPKHPVWPCKRKKSTINKEGSVSRPGCRRHGESPPTGQTHFLHLEKETSWNFPSFLKLCPADWGWSKVFWDLDLWFFFFMAPYKNERFKGCLGFFTLEAMAIKAEANIVSGFLNYVTAAQKNVIQETAKAQGLPRSVVVMWGFGGGRELCQSWS